MKKKGKCLGDAINLDDSVDPEVCMVFYYHKLVDEIIINGTNEARKKVKEVINKVRESMKIDYYDN